MDCGQFKQFFTAFAAGGDERDSELVLRKKRSGLQVRVGGSVVERMRALKGIQELQRKNFSRDLNVKLVFLCAFTAVGLDFEHTHAEPYISVFSFVWPSSFRNCRASPLTRVNSLLIKLRHLPDGRCHDRAILVPKFLERYQPFFNARLAQCLLFRC